MVALLWACSQNDARKRTKNLDQLEQELEDQKATKKGRKAKADRKRRQANSNSSSNSNSSAQNSSSSCPRSIMFSFSVDGTLENYPKLEVRSSNSSASSASESDDVVSINNYGSGCLAGTYYFTYSYDSQDKFFQDIRSTHTGQFYIDGDHDHYSIALYDCSGSSCTMEVTKATGQFITRGSATYSTYKR